MKKQENFLTKPEKLAQLIYAASIRYIKAKKTSISKKTPRFQVDFLNLRSGNENHKINV